MTKEKQKKIILTMGLYLKHKRMQQGITIAKIAKDLDLNPSTIVSIEDGKNSTSFINVYLLCKHLDINFPYFLETISVQ